MSATEEWTIERVWPADDGPSPAEVRRGGIVRGAWIGADGALTVLEPSDDPHLPTLFAAAQEGEVISHRPGKRAVVRRADGAYLKAVRAGRAGAVRAAQERAAAFGAGFLLPQVIPQASDDSTVCFTAVPGRTIAALGDDPTTTHTDWLALWESWTTAWGESVATAGVSELPDYGLVEERETLRAWAGHAGARLPEHAAALRARADRWAEMLTDAPAGPVVIAHRDLHDKQILWDPQGGIGLIDLDTCARADAGLDLGNLLAHVWFTAAQGRWDNDRRAVAESAVRRAAGHLGVVDEALEVWAGQALFRVCCVNLLRPRWNQVATRMLSEACDDATTIKEMS